MHVALVIPTLHGGGAEFVARQWIAELNAQGHKITVYLYNREQPLADLPTGIICWRFASGQSQMRRVMLPIWLRRRILTDHPDVVLSVLTYSNLATLLALNILGRSPTPVLISEHTMPSLHARAARRRDRVTYWLSRWLYRRAAGVIAVSHPIAGELVSGFGVSADRLFVIANPVISSPDQVKPSTRSAKSQGLHIAFVGRQAKSKRPDLFIAVLRELSQRKIDAHGTVIGDGPLREATEQEARDSGVEVTFTGWREPWWEAVSGVDCLLLTTQFEGFANVLVEAAAVGIPSVASSRALGVADAIVPGVTGELAITDSPRDYADAVTRATSRPPPSEDTMQRWLEHLSIKHSTAALLGVLQTLIDPLGR